MNQPIEFPIDLHHVSRRFGTTMAVNDLTLQIQRGKTFGFIGLNGAGKTTAIRMMVGLLRPHEGRINIAGIRVPEDRDVMKQQVGYVPDRPHVYPWMRVEAAIAFVRSFYPHWNQSRCDELTKLFRLDPQKRARHLSKGQGAKLSLLLAMCHDPQVLILDEPTSGLDPLVREEFLEGVLAITAERKQTVLFSSHTLADVQRLADSVGLLHEGKLLLHSPVDALLDRIKRIRTVVEDENETHEAPPGVIWQQVRGREWIITVDHFTQEQVEFIRGKNRVSRLDVQDLSLDEVFKDVVRGQKGGGMLALIRKDFRANLVPIVGATVVVMGIFTAAVAVWIGERGVPFLLFGRIPFGMGLYLTCVMAAVFGGAAFAQERRDRSADFLAMMPVSRGRIVASKIIASGIPLLLMGILFTAPIIAMDWGAWMLWKENWRVFAWEYGVPFCIFFAMYGVAWLLSTFLSSPAISASVSIGVVVGIMLIPEVVGWGLGLKNPSESFIPALVLGTIGIVCFIAGSIYYVRRVEP